MNINIDDSPQTGTVLEVVDPFDEVDEFDEVDGEMGLVTGKPETASPTGWIVYAMETGEWKGSRRYNVIAETPKEAVERVINNVGSSFVDRADRVTFEVFRQGTGFEFRYERALRQVYP